MIEKIIEFSVRRSITVAAIMFIMVAYGIYSLTKLPIDALPDITNNQVKIITLASNFAAPEIEKFVTMPIEMAMANIAGLEEVRSISKFGFSDVTLIFGDDTDIYWARSQVFERLDLIKQDLPENMGGQPYMAPVTTGLGEIYQYFLKQENPDNQAYTPAELRTIQDWIIRKQLLRVEGVAEISSLGGFVKEYQAKIFPEKMKALRVSVDEIFEALESGSGNTGGAYIEKNNEVNLIRGIGLVNTLNDIAQIVIKDNNGIPVYVRDVAEVSYGSSVRYGALTNNGNGEVVGGIVMMRKGENSSKVVERVKMRMKEIQVLLPEGITIEPIIDRSNFVGRAVKTVVTNLVEGGLIVMLVILVFLGNWRASLIAASVIPLSMLFAVILMNQTEVVGNLMSLGAIDFGLIVDSAIIVVESAVLFLATSVQKGYKVDDIKSRKRVVINASFEVQRTVIFGGLIILIVYFPILTLTGIEGKMFSPMAKTVAFAVVGALILSITYVPMICAVFLRAPKDANHHSLAEKLVDKLFEYYRPIVSYCFRIKWIVVGATVLIFSYAIYRFLNIGGEFLPKLDEGDMNIEVRLPVGSSLSRTIEASGLIQKKLMEEFPDEVIYATAKIGTSEIPTDPMPMEAFDLVVTLHDKKKWKKAEDMQNLMVEFGKVLDQNFMGITMSIQQPIENRFNDLISGAKTDVVVKVFGPNLDSLVSYGQRVSGFLQKVEGVKELQIQKLVGLPQINIFYDRAKLANYGIKVAQVNKAIQTAFGGGKAGVVYEDEKRYDISIRLHPSERNRTESVQGLLINDSRGRQIPLGEIARIETSNGYTEIYHENNVRRINVGFNVRERDMESVVIEANALISKNMQLPMGYSIEFGGQYENLSRAKARLGVVVPIALAIIFGLLYATFGTFKDSMLIYTAIPLSAIGGIFSLELREMNFSISAGVGFIALFGVAVLNGILLVGHFKKLYISGYTNVFHRVLAGLKDKFRPVIMTSLVAAFGFLPMAFSHSAGSEVQRPLATVVIGGLLSATLLTLIVLPVLYVIFNKKDNDED
jgi:cobalt-zinc-cadmium resistance protein CzcA